MNSVNKMMTEISSKNANDIKKVMLEFDSVLGIMEHEKGDISEDIQSLVDEREEARKNKDYSKADKIREQLKKKGIVLEDTPSGVRWKKV